MSMIGNYRRLPEEQLAALQADATRVPAFLYNDVTDPSHHLDIDKAWHAIHFLLNGQTWEGTGALYDAVLGGHVLGEVDVGYGPARCLSASEVRSSPTP